MIKYHNPICVRANTASQLVRTVLQELVAEPKDYPPSWERVSPRGIPTRELRDATYYLNDVTRCATWLPHRRLNYQFMAAEFLWIFCGRDDLEMIGYYNEKIKAFSDDGATFFGAYGPRWRGQIRGACENLEVDPTSRQAVIATWRPELYAEPYAPTKDVPCTVATQYLLREGRLEAIVLMRSSDAWLGLPYDLFNFAMLQRALAAELGVEAGILTLHVGSSHLYERDLERAREVLGGPLYSPTEGLVIPGPPWLDYEWIRDREESLRTGEDPELDDELDPWRALLSCLAYRGHRDIHWVEAPYRQLMEGQP
jgi:thymidylate synthase